MHVLVDNNSGMLILGMRRREKCNEEVDDKGDDYCFSGCNLQLPNLSVVSHDVHLISEGVSGVIKIVLTFCIPSYPITNTLCSDKSTCVYLISRT